MRKFLFFSRGQARRQRQSKEKIAEIEKETSKHCEDFTERFGASTKYMQMLRMYQQQQYF